MSEGDIAAARTVACDVGHAVSEVQAIYLVGSRARGCASEASDFDFVAFVTGGLRSQSPNWSEKGRAPALGFVSICNGAPVHWQLLSADYVDRRDFESNADYRASPALLMYERVQTVQTPVIPAR
jgi:hypothetical protein